MADAVPSVRMHRVLKAPVERVYRAFVEADAVVKWVAPYGITCTLPEFDARVGGKFVFRLKHFATGQVTNFSGEFLELIPNERVVYNDQADDPGIPELMKITATLRAVACGTELTILHENISAVIPDAYCYLGWQDCLAQLADLVEVEISGNG